MSKLRKIGILPLIDKPNKKNTISAAKLFENLFPNILNQSYKLPSDFIKTNWALYNTNPVKNNNLNGALFEFLLATLFYLENIRPLYFQVQVAFVPKVNFDFLCYSEEFGPIVFSAKTSLRERYKQADLEALFLKNVHRRSKSYLITLNKNEAIRVNKNIASDSVVGIDKVILADSIDFDQLVKDMNKLNFIKPADVPIISKSLRLIE